MTSPHELEALLYSDEPVLTIQVLANDPRICPTEGVFIATPAGAWTLADLEALPAQLRDECGWSAGFMENLNNRGGGIGADGLTILILVLSVVGDVPPVISLLQHLKRPVPPCPSREEAWESATWAVAMLYSTVERRRLDVLEEARHPDHWVFTMSLPESGDKFEVDVFGSRAGTVVTRVMWINGEPGRRKPGLVDPAEGG